MLPLTKGSPTSMTDDSLLNELYDQTTSDGRTIRDYTDVIHAINKEVVNKGRERLKETTFNYIMRAGVPKEPWDVWALVDTVWFQSITWAVVEGFVELTDKGRVAEGEQGVTTDVEYILSNADPNSEPAQPASARAYL